MGLTGRRPPLPAPTDMSSTDNASAIGPVSEVATNITSVTDRTHYSIPEDGSPVTITTKKVRPDKAESSTSLLIEYFEGSQTGDGKVRSRPSVRVRVTPSSSRKKSGTHDHIQITETGKNRKPSYTRRISLPGAASADVSSQSEESLGRAPVDIEVLHNGSDLTESGLSPTRFVPLSSEVSSMPPDSMLESNVGAATKGKVVQQRAQFEVDPLANDTLRAPLQRSRSISRERIAQKAAEKIRAERALAAESRRKGGGSRRSSIGSEHVENELVSTHRTTHLGEDNRSVLEPSVVSSISKLSDRTAKSGVSATSSINNPRLLSAVEDAIQRLILPELAAIKSEQKTLKNRSKYEETSRDRAQVDSSEVSRRQSLSKSSSLPNVQRPGIHTDDRGEVLSGDTIKVHKSRRASRGSTSERSEEGSRVRRKSSRSSSHTKDAVAAGVLGAAAGLTAANLKHHESASSLETRERRKKRSKSRSRSSSKHKDRYDEYSRHEESIPPLPMQSNLESDLTRESILSAETERPRSVSGSRLQTPIRELQEVSRGSPRQVISPSPRTPIRTPVSHRDVITPTGHHVESAGRVSRGSPVSVRSQKSAGLLGPKLAAAAAGVGAAAAAASLANNSHGHDSRDSNQRGYEQYTPERDVSPIQSDAGYQRSTGRVLEHDRVRSIKSDASIGSPKRSRVSHSAEGYTLDHASNTLKEAKLSDAYMHPQEYEVLPDDDEYEDVDSPYQSDLDDELERAHELNEQYREQYRSELGVQDASELGASHTVDYTGSGAEEYSDDERPLHPLERNVEYMSAPLGVESAVASLQEPSMLSTYSEYNTTPAKEAHGVLAGRGMPVQPIGLPFGGPTSKERWSHVRDSALLSADKYQQGGIIAGSPQLSGARSFESQGQPKMGASALPVAGEEIPEIGHGMNDDDSDLITNPSEVQGYLGGPNATKSHWPYESPSMDSIGQHEEHHHGHDAALLGGAATAAAGVIGLGFAAHSHEDQERELQMQQEQDYESAEEAAYAQKLEDPNALPQQDHQDHQDYHEYYQSTPARYKDEGYISATHAGFTPDGLAGFDDRSLGDFEDGVGAEDPFTTQKHLRHESGMSHGMGSPIYDAATGKGLDRIQSKDIVALMDHLTVRDAQRNARDTEILVTLVRSAAEMRNGFEEMKRFIREQDKTIMQNTDRNADSTVQKILGGPRPFPGKTSPRTARSQASDDSEARTKKANVLRRWMKGLNSRNSNELTKIEEMLMHLLDEVESLKHAQNPGGPRTVGHSSTLNSYENLRVAQDSGYEPEGRATTMSNPNHSGALSTHSSRQLNGVMHSGYERRTSEGNRISTVYEGDENLDDVEPQQQRSSPYQTAEEDQDRMPTPTRQTSRGKVTAYDTPPERAAANFGTSREVEETPNTAKTRKHKSGASSIFSHIPRISRWSKTTTSTIPESAPYAGRSDKRPSSEASRTRSSIHSREYDDDYELRDDDRLRSQTSLQRGGSATPRSPSPLIPDEYQYDDAKYHAHRNSLNLQHPQPRQGPTHRHQSHLESQAVDFEHPGTPDADLFGNTPALANNRNRYSNGSAQVPPQSYSPAYSDGAYSAHSASEQAHNQYAPPSKSSRLRDDGPLVPASASRSQTSDKNNNATTYTKPIVAAAAAPRSPPKDATQPTSPGSTNLHYGSPMLNTAVHIPSPLEPIQEVRYSLETDRSSVRHLATPSPKPMGMSAPAASGGVLSNNRKVTPAGPREMPANTSSSIRRKAVGSGAVASNNSNNIAAARHVPVNRSPVSIESYRGSVESETF